ncbi:MAG: HEAT repeat domain-containing protein [Gemmatimonadota bacterium]
MSSRRALAVGVGAALALALGVACARDSVAQTVAESGRLVRDDTASVARLLNAIRGVDPLLCELATRNVDQHGSWSRWGPMAGDPLETDSASASLIRWIQNDHSDPAVVPRLRNAMRDSDACVRRVAGSFLARVEHPSATFALVDALDDSRPEVREVAAVGLGMAEFGGAVDALIARLKDATPAVRRASAWALGSIESKKAVVPLMEVLARDSDARVRQTAAWAIGNIK